VLFLERKFGCYGMHRFAIVRKTPLSAILKSALHVNAIDVSEPQWKEKIRKEEDGKQKVQETEGRRNRARDTVRTVYVPTSLLTRCSPSQALFSSYLLFLSPSIFSFHLPFASERCASRASSLDSEERGTAWGNDAQNYPRLDIILLSERSVKRDDFSPTNSHF